jgi:hypothetical protein
MTEKVRPLLAGSSHGWKLMNIWTELGIWKARSRGSSSYLGRALERRGRPVGLRGSTEVESVCDPIL